MIQQLLDKLADLYAARDLANIEKQALIDQVLTPEIKTKLAEIDAEFSDKLQVVNDTAASLEAQVKAEVTTHGATVKGDYLQAVWSKGRTSWDTKALDGYAAAHPEIERFKTIGAPSVSIRKVG